MREGATHGVAAPCCLVCLTLGLQSMFAGFSPPPRFLLSSPSSVCDGGVVQEGGEQPHAMLARCGGLLVWGQAHQPCCMSPRCGTGGAGRQATGQADSPPPLLPLAASQLHLEDSSTLPHYTRGRCRESRAGKRRASSRRALGKPRRMHLGRACHLGGSDIEWRWRGCLQAAALGGRGRIFMAAPGRVVAVKAQMPPGSAADARAVVGREERVNRTRAWDGLAPGVVEDRLALEFERGEARAGGEQVWLCREVAGMQDPLRVYLDNRICGERGGGEADTSCGAGRGVYVQQVSAGERCALVLLSNGTVLRFGSGYLCRHLRGGDVEAASGDGDSTPMKTPGTAAGRNGSADLDSSTSRVHPACNRQGVGRGKGPRGAERVRSKVASLVGSTMWELQDHDIVLLAAGDTHALAMSRAGEVWAWGCNMAGQLGDGTISCSARPVQVRRETFTNGSAATDAARADACAALLTKAAKIAAGGAHSVAAMEDGRVMTWGCGNCGQLGDGFAAGTWPGVRLQAGAVVGLAGVFVVDVSAGAFHTLALSATGDVYAWGYNAHGQVGDGTTISASAPFRVLAGAHSIAAGSAHSLALRYRMHDGNASSSSAPARAVTQSGELQVFSWGSNHCGQVGNSTHFSHSSPTLALATRLPPPFPAGAPVCVDGEKFVAPPGADLSSVRVVAGGHTSALVWCPQAAAARRLPSTYTPAERQARDAASAPSDAPAANLGLDSRRSSTGVSVEVPSWCAAPGRHARAMVLLQEEAGEVVGVHALDGYGCWVVSCHFHHSEGGGHGQASLPVIVPHACSSGQTQRSSQRVKATRSAEPTSAAGRESIEGGPLALVAYGVSPPLHLGNAGDGHCEDESSIAVAAYYVMSLENGGSCPRRWSGLPLLSRTCSHRASCVSMRALLCLCTR